MLINPPYSRLRGTKESTEMVTPIGLSYIAAYLKSEGHDVLVYDSNYSPVERLPRFNNLKKLFDSFDKYADALKLEDHPVWDECAKVVEREKPDVVGVSVLSPVRGAALRIARICKSVDPAVKVVFGGYHPSGYPEDVLSQDCVDAVVRGEGEKTFSEYVKAWGGAGALRDIPGLSFKDNGSVVHNQDRDLIEDLDSLPFPTDFLLERVTGKAPIQYGRGCPFGCKFCSDIVIWKRRTRYRSAENVVDEMTDVIKRKKLREFTFIDGTFNINREKVVVLCELLLRKKM
ncbi:MAG TPA: cobalamin-dependent protein, partial [bacterium]|nr:cobalamin-dependent protein [bacterium]